MDYSQSNFNSYSVHLIGASSSTIPNIAGKKIVAIDFLQSGTASNTWVECDGLQIARNFARDAEVDLSFKVATSCKVQKTGADEAFVTVIYSATPTTAYYKGSLETPDVLLLLIPTFFFFFFLVTKFWISLFRK